MAVVLLTSGHNSFASHKNILGKCNGLYKYVQKVNIAW